MKENGTPPEELLSPPSSQRKKAAAKKQQPQLTSIKKGKRARSPEVATPPAKKFKVEQEVKKEQSPALMATTTPAARGRKGKTAVESPAVVEKKNAQKTASKWAETNSDEEGKGRQSGVTSAA